MSFIPSKVKNKELVERRRRQIVLAAIKLFSRKGFHKTSLRELAEEAGISHGNIYDYVRSKEDIFFLVHEFVHRLFDEAITQSIRNVDAPLEKLRRMVRAEFNLMYQWSDAILLIYQETHILSNALLKRLLQTERKHVQRFEAVLNECIQAGRLRDANLRITANLIKIMAETWVVKRWDIRGEVSRLEMEKAILDLVFHGLLKGEEFESLPLQPRNMPEGKLALVTHGGTLLGQALTSFLLSKGISVAVHTKRGKEGADISRFAAEDRGRLRIYPLEDHGPLTARLLKGITADFGSFDIIIQDVGIGYLRTTISEKMRLLALQELETNLQQAQGLASSLVTEMAERGSGHIVYLAPWAWDGYADPLRYETVKGGTVALTRAVADRTASSGVNVNCILPGFIGGARPLSIEKEKADQSLERVPMGCLGEVSDVLNALNFLISDESKYVTGQVLKVGGGLN